MLKSGKPRIAICFSGQPRTWRNCVKTWKENLFPDYDVDVFCHIWDFNTLPNSITVGSLPNEVKVEQSELDELLAVLKPKKFKIESSKEFTTVDSGQRVLDPSMTQFNGGTKIPSFRSQYYGIMQAARLKRQYEIENDFQYDIVVRMRYDAFFTNPITQEFTFDKRIDQYNMYCIHYSWTCNTNRGRVGDIFWYAASETYDIIADYYLNISHLDPNCYRNLEGPNQSLYPENMFCGYIKKNDIMFDINHTLDIKLFRLSKELSYTKDLNGFEIW